MIKHSASTSGPDGEPATSRPVSSTAGKAFAAVVPSRPVKAPLAGDRRIVTLSRPPGSAPPRSTVASSSLTASPGPQSAPPTRATPPPAEGHSGSPAAPTADTSRTRRGWQTPSRLRVAPALCVPIVGTALDFAGRHDERPLTRPRHCPNLRPRQSICSRRIASRVTGCRLGFCRGCDISISRRLPVLRNRPQPFDDGLDALAANPLMCLRISSRRRGKISGTPSSRATHAANVAIIIQRWQGCSASLFKVSSCRSKPVASVVTTSQSSSTGPRTLPRMMRPCGNVAA